jgi:hypothetical protein
MSQYRIMFGFFTNGFVCAVNEHEGQWSMQNSMVYFWRINAFHRIIYSLISWYKGKNIYIYIKIRKKKNVYTFWFSVICSDPYDLWYHLSASWVCWVTWSQKRNKIWNETVYLCIWWFMFLLCWELIFTVCIENVLWNLTECSKYMSLNEAISEKNLMKPAFFKCFSLCSETS